MGSYSVLNIALSCLVCLFADLFNKLKSQVPIAYYCPLILFCILFVIVFRNSGIRYPASWTLRGSPSSLLPSSGIQLPVGPGQGRNSRGSSPQEIVDNQCIQLERLHDKVSDSNKRIPNLFKIPKFHKRPYRSLLVLATPLLKDSL